MDSLITLPAISKNLQESGAYLNHYKRPLLEQGPTVSVLTSSHRTDRQNSLD